MSYLQAIIIAIIEGLTEFLPISSTAHMKFADAFMEIPDPAFADLFEIVIQLAAILAVVVLYWKQFFDFKKIHFYFKLIIAVLPAVVVGFLLKKHIDKVLDNLIFISIIMIIGGVVLVYIDRFFIEEKQVIHTQEKVSYKIAFVIGCFQILAILLPGLSRSASTIIGGLSQKLNRNTAAAFSFFLAVPTMLAASVKSTFDVYTESPALLSTDNLSVLLLGCIVSFIVAIIAIKTFIAILNKYGFKYFGYYRIILGICLLTYFIIHQ